VEVPVSVVQAAGNTNNGSATWTYSLADSKFDFLAAGEILTLTYTATVNDGHGGVVSQPFTVTITGTDDLPVITSAAQTGAVTEDTNIDSSGNLNAAGGTITFTDVDLTDTHTVSASAPTFVWSGGTLTAAQQAALTAASTFTPTPTPAATGGTTATRGST